jgi:hypothetical protein
MPFIYADSFQNDEDISLILAALQLDTRSPTATTAPAPSTPPPTHGHSPAAQDSRTAFSSGLRDHNTISLPAVRQHQQETASPISASTPHQPRHEEKSAPSANPPRKLSILVFYT